ncbi:glycerol-3-phosphate responsive antiterminator [Paenibacillus sp. 1P07SE]|uniref:glycerol-3-phosphate responsive antiterminator n=1 Tax=Paenibacillus sp. 1P07SE TaxID=3132209 RepID=UPI0039A5E14D
MSRPMIASITREDQVAAALSSRVQRINLMTGNINTLHDLVQQLREGGRRVFVHIEMVGGLGRDAAAMRFLSEQFGIDGIITTKSNAISHAKQAGLATIQRFFAIDSAAVDTAIRMIGASQPDEVELMPGLMPRIIQEVKSRVKQPLIVGGLIRSEEEIAQALESGADYVSVGDSRFW